MHYSTVDNGNSNGDNNGYCNNSFSNGNYSWNVIKERGTKLKNKLFVIKKVTQNQFP